MSQKQKDKTEENLNFAKDVAGYLGSMTMTAAVLLTVTHAEHFAHPHKEGHSDKKEHVIVHSAGSGQFVFDDQLRRGSEETRHDSATYGAPKMSHPVAGTV